MEHKTSNVLDDSQYFYVMTNYLNLQTTIRKWYLRVYRPLHAVS